MLYVSISVLKIDEDTTEEALKLNTEPNSKLEIPVLTNYDLLCIEGISQSLNEYLVLF